MVGMLRLGCNRAWRAEIKLRCRCYTKGYNPGSCHSSLLSIKITSERLGWEDRFISFLILYRQLSSTLIHILVRHHKLSVSRSRIHRNPFLAGVALIKNSENVAPFSQKECQALTQDA